VVLRTVTSAMAAVADDGDNHLLVGLVISEHLFESLRQGVEVAISDCSVFKHFRLDLGECQIASVNTVVSLFSSILSLVGEEIISSGGHQVVDFVPSQDVAVTGGFASVGSALQPSVEASTSGSVVHGA
jgi:hypothetical protein